MIGEKLKELLKLRGMRQSELARLAGVSRTTINSIIMRNNKNVDFSLMERISDILDVPIEYFFDREIPEVVEGKVCEHDEDDSEIHELISIYSELNMIGRQALMGTARGLASNPDMKKGGVSGSATA